jgi:Predicted membrane protein
MSAGQISRNELGALLIRLLLGSLFIAHLYWKVAILPGGLSAWRDGLVSTGYPPFVLFYVLTAEVLGALLLIPGILTRYVALYALPMMLGATHFWFARNGFYFTKAGAELPLVWAALLCIQAVLGDGLFALVRSPSLDAMFARIGIGRASGIGLFRVPGRVKQKD